MDLVQSECCDAGFALDGDGGRCMAVDADGEIVDGDRILAILCQDALDANTLSNHGVAVTEKTNLGFLRFAQQQNIAVHMTQAGPRFVLDKMHTMALSLGGDRSGYLYFTPFPAADGLVTIAKILGVMQRTEKPLSELAKVMEHDPQVSVSLRILPHWREIWKNAPSIVHFIAERAAELGTEGRILVREHKKEAAIQILLEGRDFKQINTYAFAIADHIQKYMNDTEAAR